MLFYPNVSKIEKKFKFKYNFFNFFNFFPLNFLFTFVIKNINITNKFFDAFRQL